MGRRRNRHLGPRVVLTLAAAFLLLATGCTWIGRQSVNDIGSEGHGTSDQVAVSADGRFVAFSSDAPDLVNDDFNLKRDVFVRDNGSGVTTRVSIASDETESDGDSSHPAISDDGRYVAFESLATNLTIDDASAGSDVFVRDRTLGTTVLVSPIVGAPSPSPAQVATATAAGTSSGPKQPATPPALSPARPAADGTVRVVVRSRTDFTPNAALAPAQQVAQHTDLATGRAAVERAVQTHGGQVVRSIDGQPFVAARIPAKNVAALRSDPSVSQVTYDYVVRPTDVQSNALIGSTIANASGIDGRGTTVAILDAGVDKAHPFLAGRVVAEGCFTSTGSCPNGENTQTGSGAGVPCPYLGCNHGTHVAGIAAGRRVGAGTFDGVAPGASIISVEIFSLVPECACLGAYNTDLIAGLQYVGSLRNTFKIAAVNMSLGGGPRPGACDDDPLKPAIDDLRASGIATVIASGNEGSIDGIDAPACISSAVSVGAVDNSDLFASFSNSASNVALLAPGVGVSSSVPGGGFESLSGTSMAAPHVAGLWTLFKQLQPNASVSGALAWLRATGRQLRDDRNDVVTPRVCAATAFSVGHCPDPALPPPPANDNFANASPLVGAAGTVTGTNIRSRMEPGEPNHAGQVSPTSVWYSFQAPATGVLSVDTYGSSFDTVLALYSGSSVGALTSLAANDDTPTGLQSSINAVPVQAGTTYHVAVAGYSGATGAVNLTWRFQPSLGNSTSPSISADGRYVAFASDVSKLIATDTNNATDVFVRDLTTRATIRVSVAGNGTAANGPSSHPAISGDGSRVAFASAATNLVASDGNGKTDVFVRSRAESTSIKKVSTAGNGAGADGASDRPALDRTGATIAFDSDATNLVAGDVNHARDVFVLPITATQAQRVSLTNGGSEANGPSSAPSLSADGRYVAFTSGASNLVTGDTKGLDDGFVRDRTGATTRRISSAIDDTESNGPTSGAAISRDGDYVGFVSTATNLVTGDGNESSDVFLRRRQPVTISSVTPGTAERGSSLVFVIRGTGFLAGAQISIPDTVVTAVMVTSPTQINVAVQVPLNAAPGNRNVVVQVAGASWDLSTGANAICVNCVRLT